MVKTDENVKEYASGAKYELAGQCQICGKKVWHCISHPLRDAGMDKTDIAVFVPSGRPTTPSDDYVPEPPTVYCIVHDPTRNMQNRRGRAPGETPLGDNWSPLA
jgi:hypothetical protein